MHGRFCRTVEEAMGWGNGHVSWWLPCQEEQEEQEGVLGVHHCRLCIELSLARFAA